MIKTLSLLQNSLCIENYPLKLDAEEGGHFWHDLSVETLITPAMTNDNTACRMMARWNVVQHDAAGT